MGSRRLIVLVRRVRLANTCNQITLWRSPNRKTSVALILTSSHPMYDQTMLSLSVNAQDIKAQKKARDGAETMHMRIHATTGTERRPTRTAGRSHSVYEHMHARITKLASPGRTPCNAFYTLTDLSMTTGVLGSSCKRHTH